MIGKIIRREVAIGQRFQQDGSTTVWEVVELTQDAEGNPHARLYRVGDATAVKLLSCSALKDPRLYRLVEPEAFR